MGCASGSGATITKASPGPGSAKPGVERYRFYQGVIFLLAVCYLAQIFTPLRLSYDAEILLSMAESAAQGRGFLDNGQPTVHPPGYPALLAVLLKAGIAHPWVIVGVNGILLFVALGAAARVLRLRLLDDRPSVLSVCVLSLLSFIVIRHFTMPVTEITFFGVAMCCLAAMEYASASRFGREFLCWMLASWILTLASIAVRRIGVALIPALAWTMIFHPEAKMFLKCASNRLKAGAAFSVVAAGIGIAWTVAKTSTLREFSNLIRGYGILGAVLRILAFRLRELGEIAVNVPSGTLPASVRGIVPFLGMLFLALIFAGLFLKRKNFGPTGAFLCGYIAVLSLWAWRAPRFWLPVIPLLIAYARLAIQRILPQRLSAAVIALHGIIFAVLGVAVLAAAVRVSLTAPKFAEACAGEGDLRPTYCAVFHSCTDPGPINPRALHLLQTYK